MKLDSSPDRIINCIQWISHSSFVNHEEVNGSSKVNVIPASAADGKVVYQHRNTNILIYKANSGFNFATEIQTNYTTTSSNGKSTKKVLQDISETVYSLSA